MKIRTSGLDTKIEGLVQGVRNRVASKLDLGAERNQLGQENNFIQ